MTPEGINLYVRQHAMEAVLLLMLADHLAAAPDPDMKAATIRAGLTEMRKTLAARWARLPDPTAAVALWESTTNHLLETALTLAIHPPASWPQSPEAP